MKGMALGLNAASPPPLQHSISVSAAFLHQT